MCVKHWYFVIKLVESKKLRSNYHKIAPDPPNKRITKYVEYSVWCRVCTNAV